jgi:hypothetical protein
MKISGASEAVAIVNVQSLLFFSSRRPVQISNSYGKKKGSALRACQMALLMLSSFLLSSLLRNFCDHSVHRMRIGRASDSKSDARPIHIHRAHA